MTRRNHGISAIALGAVVALTAGCGGAASPPATNADGASAAKAGGTLYYLTKRAAEHMDPQRTYIGRDLSNQSRLVYRTLTQYKSGPKDVSTKIQPDLATDTGTASDGGKTWKFTLKDGVKWEDNSDITCEDLKYGISRTFATSVITGGPAYAIQFLDIPKVGTPPVSVYKGPYVTDAAGQAAFDKAVTCEGKTVTYKLGQAVGDFNLAVTMSAFAPYKKAQDKGDKSNFAMFSSGPYKVEGGAWVKGKGATFVRNAAYDPKTDTLRGAFPDKIVYTEGIEDEVIAQRLLSDSGNDKFAVSDRRIPPSMRPQFLNNPAAKARSENVLSPFMDYVVPNFKKVTDLKVRQALAMSTDKAGYVAASGGTTAGAPSQSIISPDVLGYKKFSAFDAPDAGDPVKAKALLTEAGKVPYPITYTFSGGTPTTQKAAAALKAGWEKAGFAVTLNELTDTYYDVIQNPANADKHDVAWGGWAADWPAASTVIPPLFDARVQINAASTGNDYGYYNNPELSKKIDAAFAETDLAKQAALWGDMDEFLAKDVAFIPLMNQKFFLSWGSGVKGWVDNPSVSSYPDLGAIGVQ
jgi:peptide/nickel transport system substrate-binding protein